MPKRISIAVVFCFALWVPCRAQVTSITVQPVNPTRQVNNQQQFQALDQNSNDITLGVDWTSSDNTIATIVSGPGGSAGLATPVAPGSAAITATQMATTVSASPASLAFGNQNVGTGSVARTITLTNTGSWGFFAGVSLTGTDPGDFSQTNNCGMVLPGAACSINVTFTPSVAAARSASVRTSDNATGSPQSVALTGTGTSGAPAVAFAPTSLSFGTQTTGTSTLSQSVVLTNTGSATLNISAIALAGSNPGDFSQGNSCGSTLAAGTSCTINVTFSPTTTGARSATVSVTDDAAGSPQTVPLTGTGIAPASPGATLSPASLAFGNQRVGVASATRTIVLTSSGTATLIISSVTVTGANAGDFGLTNFCPGSLAVGSTCNLVLTFTPSATGSRSASLSVADNAAGTPQTAALSGTGVTPVVSLAPASVAFGSQIVNTTTAASSVTLSNTGSSTLTIMSISIGGTNAGDFAQSNNCPGALAASSSCRISVTFTPTVAASRSASVSVADDAAGSPQTVALTGTGTAGSPAVSFSPTSLAFAARNTGTSSAQQAIVLTNTGTAVLNIASISLAGSNPGDFSQTNGCGSTLAAGGGNCTINVTFSPTVAAARSATVSVTDDAAGSPQTVPLTGVGLSPGSPGISFSPASLTFGNQRVRVTSSAQHITVTSSGSVALTISSITLTGGMAADYSQTNNCPASLAASATCTISVTFTPGATGLRSASISVSDNAGGSPHTVGLSGTGIAPNISVNPTSLAFGNQALNTASSPNSVTVSNSGTAAGSISIRFTDTNPGDFSQTNNCPASLGPSSSCDIAVTFTPAVAAARSATLTLGGAPSVALTGTGTSPAAPVASLAPGSLAFGNVTAGTSSASRAIVLTNTGSASLTISSISITGTNPGDFSETNNCTSSLTANGGNCTINVTFTPSVVGARSATLSISDNASGSPHTAALTGTGTSAGFPGAPKGELP